MIYTFDFIRYPICFNFLNYISTQSSLKIVLGYLKSSKSSMIDLDYVQNFAIMNFPFNVQNQKNFLEYHLLFCFES